MNYKLQQAIEYKTKRIENQKEECESIKQRILKSLSDNFSSSELSKASIIYARNEVSLRELESQLELLYSMQNKW